MDFDWSAELVELREEAQAVARGLASRYGTHEDCWMTAHSAEAAREVATRGWIGMTLPVEVGGGGRSPVERFLVIEALMEHGVPMADWWFAEQLIGPVLVGSGSPDQQARWLPDIIAGRARWTIASAEPGAGSDPTSMTTSAVTDGDDLVISGTKIWVLGPADWCYLVFRADATAGRAGMSEIVVDLRSEGVRFEPIRDASGRQDFGLLYFDEVRVPAANLIGGGSSSLRVLRELDRERGGIDRLVCNRALYLDVRRSLDLSDPILRQRVARLESDYRVGRLLVLRTVLGPRFPGLTGVVKVFCSEYEQRVADFGASAAGLAGLLDARRGGASIYSRAYTLMGGTSQMLRTIIGERALGLPPEDGR